jgi:hypothetical protein
MCNAESVDAAGGEFPYAIKGFMRAADDVGEAGVGSVRTQSDSVPSEYSRCRKY